MKIIKQSTKKYTYKFEYSFDYSVLNFCRTLKDEYGYLSFGFESGSWRFNNLDFVKIIKDRYQDVEIGKEIKEDFKLFNLEKKKEKIKIKKAEELKNAVDSDLVVKGIKGKLYGYQKATLEWLLNNNGRGLVSLDLGLGKTFVSLAYVAHTMKKKTLVICPVSMKYTWLKETSQWTRLKAMVIDSKSELTLENYQKNDIFIINFDILKKFFTFLTSVKFDCLIVDESSMIKSPKAIRSKAVKTISEKINSVILLSGSPLLNRVVEIYTSLNILDPVKWNSYYHFVYRYCAAYQSRWGLDTSGSSRIPELKEKIDNLIIRKKKEDVLKELPDKKFIDIPIKLKSSIQKKYDLIEQNFIKYLKEVKKKNKKDIRKSLLAEQLVKLNELRQLASIGKIDSTKDLIQNIIDSGEKVLVFGNFNEPLNIFERAFKEESVMIIGSTSDVDRRKAIDEFQNNPKIKIFFGGMHSAGMGITLTAASNVIFHDFDWTPEVQRQCFSRADRIGQKANSINIFQVIALDTIDQKMVKILKKKQEIIDQLIDGKETKVKENNLFKDVIDSYNLKK